MPHEDGPKYEPIVTILSLGAPVVFRFYEKPCSLTAGSESNPGKPALSLILPSKSLLVFRGKYYDQYLHGIEAVQQEIVDSTVANRNLFPRQEGVPGADEDLERDLEKGAENENDEEGKNGAAETQHGVGDAWSFPRGGTRVSLTMRNGFQKIACVQL